MVGGIDSSQRNHTEKIEGENIFEDKEDPHSMFMRFLKQRLITKIQKDQLNPNQAD